MARDVELMATGLRRYLAGGKAITRVTPLSTGHSNETYLLEGLQRILRMPPSEKGLLPPYDMVREHTILSSVAGWDPALPVPKVYEVCDDSSVIGAPFYVMEYLSGEAFEYAVPDWLLGAAEQVRHVMSAQWVGAVSALHRMPVARMPGHQASVREEAEHWRAVAEEAEAPVDLIGLLDDLIIRPPANSGPPAPVHGDPKHGNCLWQGGELRALLDWEMAKVGEPLMDLGYMTSFYDQGEAALASAGLDLPGWWSREQVIDAWENQTGRRAVDLRRYEALAMAKIAAIIALGYHLYRSGQARDPRFEVWGVVLPKYLALTLQRAQL